MRTLKRLFARLCPLPAALALSAMLVACQDDGVCKDVQGVHVCGDLGTMRYTIDLTAQPIEWPPVAVQNGELIVARGQELLKVTRDGQLHVLGSADQPLTVPSSDEQGNLFLLGGGGQSSVRALNGQQASQSRWTTPLVGSPAGAPPSVGSDTVYAATTQGGDNPTLYALDRDTGAVRYQRKGASPAAVLPDGSIRYLRNPMGLDSMFGTDLGGQPRFGELVAEDGHGKTLWTLAFTEGLVDFAPGPSGETYIVTGGDHVLQRISYDGRSEWTFRPDCQNCTVAAAPTVTRDVVYFPVWEVRTQPVDPLFALDAKSGKPIWVFDGFSTRESAQASSKFLAAGASGGTPVDQWSVKHHPAGRPVVAEDGTLYVSTDGAVTVLDRNGQVNGIALYDASVGEVGLNTGFMAAPATWINPGVRPSPVLGPDGTLFVWDGATLRAFDAGKKATSAAWIAPFGSVRNDGRVPQQ